MKKQYVDSIAAADADIKNLEKTQKYWERSASDAQGNLKDILQGPRTWDRENGFNKRRVYLCNKIYIFMKITILSK